MSEYTTVVTRKGQITIPVEIRRSLGLKEGDRVSLFQDGDQVRLAPTGSVVQRTAGVAARYRQGPSPTLQELRDAVEQAIAEEVVESMGGR